MNSDLKIGDVVMLSPTTEWNTSDVMNPLYAEGVVTDIDPRTTYSHGWVTVDWENTEKGLTNAYRLCNNDLILQDGGE
jgi:hypothetical protein